MKYTIGEVADFLHVSMDMILSECNEASNYRIYDNMAIFGLLDAIQHKHLDMNIREIEEIRKGDYESNMSRYLDKYYDALNKNLSYGATFLNVLKSLKPDMQHPTRILGIIGLKAFRDFIDIMSLMRKTITLVR